MTSKRRHVSERKRNVTISALTKGEVDKIRRRAQRAGMSVSAFLRELALGRPVRARSTNVQLQRRLVAVRADQGRLANALKSRLVHGPMPPNMDKRMALCMVELIEITRGIWAFAAFEILGGRMRIQSGGLDTLCDRHCEVAARIASCIDPSVGGMAPPSGKSRRAPASHGRTPRPRTPTEWHRPPATTPAARKEDEP